MKHLFFDLDRTLWDFESNSELALSHLFDELKLEDHFRSFRSFHTAYKKINAKLWYDYSKNEIAKDQLRVKRFVDTFSSFGVKEKELAEQLAELYVGRAPHLTQLFPNTLETLEDLKNDGYAMHIITNGFREVQFIKLEKSGLLPYFDVILCSEDVGQQKPAKIVFDHALELAKTTADKSIMIGDSYHADIIGAERAGMKSILFDPHSEHRQGTHEWHIKALNQLPEILTWMYRS